MAYHFFVLLSSNALIHLSIPSITPLSNLKNSVKHSVASKIDNIFSLSYSTLNLAGMYFNSTGIAHS